MAGILDFLLNPSLLGGIAQSPGPDWEALRRANLGLPSDQQQPLFRYNQGAPGSMVDLRGGGAFAIPPGPSQAPQRAFGYGAQNLSGLTSTGLPPYFPTQAQAPPLPPSTTVNVSPVGGGDATLPTNAQSTQGYAISPGAQPQAAPQRPTGPPLQQIPGQPNFGDWLTATFQNLIQTKDPFSAIGNAIIGATTGQRTDPAGAYQQMAGQTYQALIAAGYPQADAALAASNPEVLKTLVTNAYQQPKFEKAGPGEAAYLVGGGQGRLGPGGGGPSGVSGAGVTQLTPGMSVQEKAAQEAAGQKQGQSAATLPATLSAADQALALVKAVQEHPGRNAFSSSGALAKLPAIPGTEAYNYRAAVSQLKSQAFLSAFNTLRGGGQISNVEGEKATEAMVQLDLAQSQPARDKAIATLRSVIETGRENAIRMAQGRTEPFPTPQTPSAPQGQVGGSWTQISPNVRVRPMQ